MIKFTTQNLVTNVTNINEDQLAPKVYTLGVDTLGINEGRR